ncbi:hypothetical protein A3L12_00415 [Thermococcus sp. P6]|nr:hypothetical protein [Thermococcus sp. P6]ASJ09872.1 hypothetical protein A3L12_00415 [Thermococcus sp. P6]
MEEELIEKALAYLRVGDVYFEEKRFDLAHKAYMDALYTIGALLVYLDTGILMPAEEMAGILKGKHPGVYALISRYAGITAPDGETLRSLRAEVTDLLSSFGGHRGSL